MSAHRSSAEWHDVAASVGLSTIMPTVRKVTNLGRAVSANQPSTTTTPPHAPRVMPRLPSSIHRRRYHNPLESRSHLAYSVTGAQASFCHLIDSDRRWQARQACHHTAQHTPEAQLSTHSLASRHSSSSNA